MKKIAIILVLIIIPVAFYSGCRASANDISGLWYDKTGFAGTLEFKDGGVVALAISDKVYSGTYSFDAENGKGKINIDDPIVIESSFTLSDGLLNVDNGAVTYTRDKTNQQDVGNLLKSLGKAAGN